MTLGASFAYKLLFAVHILSVIAAFGPTLVYAMIGREARARSGKDARSLALLPLAITMKLSLPSLVIAALSGVGLVADSNDVWQFSKPWVSAAFTVVLLLLLLIWFLLRPAQQRMADAVAKGMGAEGELRAAKATAGIAAGLLHLGLVILIVLMVWKPGQ